MGLRLDEVDCKSPCEIGSKENTEGSAFGMRVAVITLKGKGEQGEEENVVKLSGMTMDTIAEIHSPREVSGCAESIVS